MAARSGLSRLLERNGCQAVLVVARSARDPDLAPFVGDAHLGRSFLIAGRDATLPPRLAYLTAMEREEAAGTGCDLLEPEALGVTELLEEGLTEAEQWAALLSQGLLLAGVAPGRVALAGHAAAGSLLAAAARLAAEGWEVVDGSPLLRSLRKRKSEDELAEARRVAAATGEAMVRIADLLASATERRGELWLEGERLTAGRLRAEVAGLLAAHLLEQPEGNIVAAGADSAVPHTQGRSDRVLRPGQSLIVDLFPRGGLFADCTRTFCVGEPPARLRAAWAAVRAALESARGRAQEGVDGWTLQQEACDCLEAAGHPTVRSHPGTTRGYVHGVGHGVGFELHELPSFRREAGEQGVLEAGDLFTLEPGLYDPEAGYGVRLEDLCCLTAGGLENLTAIPYDLDPRAWRA